MSHLTRCFLSTVLTAMIAASLGQPSAQAYEYLKSNPINRLDPTGLSALDNAWQQALANWSEYLETYQGRAWTNRIGAIADASDIFGNPVSSFDEDVFGAIDYLQTNRITTLQRLEQASFQLRHGHKLSTLYTAGAHEWDQVVWERDEAILFSLAFGGFGARACFVEGTQVLLPDGSTQPIEEIGVATRVASRPADPRLVVADISVDPESWRVVRLETQDAQRGKVSVSLLRPLDWVDANHAEPGASIALSVPEMGLHGLARVLSVEPCPDSTAGSATAAVTGTFATEKARTVDVYLDSVVEPIGTTEEHPFYSADQNRWVAANRLEPGELVLTATGDAVVQCVEPRRDAEAVYNLEVHGTHSYFVSSAAAWVHNGCSVNQVQQLISRGKAPRTIRGAELGKEAFGKAHIHFDGKHALNIDGTWRHGGRALTRAEKDFIKMIGWTLP